MERETLQPIDKFNHCASIIEFYDGVLIAYYAGSRECNDDQRIILTYKNVHQPKKRWKWSDAISFEIGTGNPILFKHDNAIYVAYAKFERDFPQRVKKWAYCSLWCRKISLSTQLVVGDPMPMFKHPQIGFLFRIAPFYHDGRTFLPIYREENCYSAVYEWLGDKLKLIGRIGYGCNSTMQPSLWYDGTAFHALCRNYRPSVYGPYAWHSTSPNLIDWSHPELEKTLDNNNNSIAVINDDKKDPLVIWNVGMDRRDLRLGRLNGHMRGISYVTLNSDDGLRYGSYPNYCFDKFNGLHMVWTDMIDDNLSISYMSLNEKEYRQLRK